MNRELLDTIIKLLEDLPEPLRHEVLTQLSDYVLDALDEYRWDASFKRTQAQLVTASRRARREIAEGKGLPFDLDSL